MFQRLTAALAIGALVALSASPATAVSAPKPAPTPLKTITHIHSSPLCTGLRRAITPAIAKVLDTDHLIATSKPFFHDYVHASATGQNKAAEDMSVEHLENLIGPLVNNTEAVEKLLTNPYAFPRSVHSSDDKRLLQMRAQLYAVNEQQKRALDLISGFVQTQQLGELQAAGHEYDAAINSTSTATTPPNPAPSAPSSDVLNAGVGNSKNDPSRAMDPRYMNSNNLIGANPLNVFENSISSYQADIEATEQDAAKSVVQAVVLCGGRAPGQPAPSPSPTPSP